MLDLCLGGDLRYALNKKGAMEENLVKFYVASLTKALEYMHSKGVIHRDIKPDNMLLDSNGYLKLTDLGISSKLDEHDMCFRASGTKGYMAPEVTNKGQGHSRASDYYSVGIVTYELLTKAKPPKKNSDETWHGIFSKDANLKSVSKDCRDFMEKCLEYDESERIGAHGSEDVYKHPWFKEFDFKGLEMGTLVAPFIPDITKPNFEAEESEVDDILAGGRRASIIFVSDEDQLLFEAYNFNDDPLNPGVSSPSARPEIAKTNSVVFDEADLANVRGEANAAAVKPAAQGGEAPPEV